jgi:hypothetical protein
MRHPREFGGNGPQSILAPMKTCHGGGPPVLQDPNGEGSNGLDQHEGILVKSAVGDWTDDKDDPFADLRANPNLKIGSYGIHVDAQHNALTKIVEAKAFAKAVKADDTEVPVYLWKNWIKTQSSLTEA